MSENQIGQKIKELRKSRKMSQEALAEELGVSKQTISNWEVGRKSPRMKAVKKMAELFDVPEGSILAALPAEVVSQAQEDIANFELTRTIDLDDDRLKLMYRGCSVPDKYIDALKLMLESDYNKGLLK